MFERIKKNGEGKNGPDKISPVFAIIAVILLFLIIRML